MSINAKKITSRLIAAKRITARLIQSGVGAICRYFFTFDGDGFITTDRRWNPDAANPSFVVEFFNDTSVNIETEFVTQGNSGGGDLAVRTQASGNIGLYLGGNAYNITTAVDMGLAMWRIEYDDSTNIVKTYKDDVLIGTKLGVSIGGSRMPSSPFVISDGDTGVMANVRFWINGSTKLTADLVLDMPINDNSNTIKDYAPQISGDLTAGTGNWIFQNNRYFFDFAGDGFIQAVEVWNPDAIDTSFELELYNDLAIEGHVFSQADANNNIELRLFSDSTQCRFSLAGQFLNFILTPDDAGVKLWIIKYSTGTLEIFRGGQLRASRVTGVGAIRATNPSLYLMSRLESASTDSSLLYNVKFWVDGDRITGDLILDMPIDDNNNVVKNIAPRVGGVLTPGTGSWSEVCEGDDSFWDDADLWNDSDPWID